MTARFLKARHAALWRAAALSLLALAVHKPSLADDGLIELQAIAAQVRAVFDNGEHSLEPLWKALVKDYRCEPSPFKEINCTPSAAQASSSVVERISWKAIASNQQAWMRQHLTIQLRKFDSNAPTTLRRELFGTWKQEQGFSLHGQANCLVSYRLHPAPSDPVGPVGTGIQVYLQAQGSNCDLDTTAIHFTLQRLWQLDSARPPQIE